MKRKVMVVLSTVIMIMVFSIPLVLETKGNTEPIINVNEAKHYTKAGTYFIDIKADNEENQTMKERVRIHVKYPKTVLNYDAQEGIDGHDIIVLKDTFKTYSKQDLIDKASVHAWSMNTGEVIQDVNISIKNPKQNSGTISNIEYSTNNNTKMEVNVFEQDEIPLQLDELYMNQYAIVTDRLTVISSLLIGLSVFPIIIFVALFSYMYNRKDKMIKLLGASTKEGQHEEKDI